MSTAHKKHKDDDFEVKTHSAKTADHEPVAAEASQAAVPEAAVAAAPPPSTFPTADQLAGTWKAQREAGRDALLKRLCVEYDVVAEVVKELEELKAK